MFLQGVPELGDLKVNQIFREDFFKIEISSFMAGTVFKVKESISRSFTKLPESGDFKNPGQLPVSEVL